MADSLLDFGNLTQLAQNNLRNAMQMQQMGMQEQQLDLQGRRTAVDEQQLAINRINATQAQIKNLHDIYKDPRVQATPELRNQLMFAFAKLAGAPAVGLDAIQSRNEEVDNWMRGLASGNPEEVLNAYRGLSITMTPQQWAEFQKDTEGAAKLREQNRSISLLRQMNEEKFQQVRDNTAKVNMGKHVATSSSIEFGRLLKGMDSKEVSSVLDTFQTKQELWSALMSSTNHLARDAKRRIPQVLDGKMKKQALEFEQVAGAYMEDAKSAEDALKQFKEKKVSLPEGVSPAMMRAKMEMSQLLGDAHKSMSDWMLTPFDKTKYAAAKSAAQNIETYRKELEALDRKTSNDSLELKQSALALMNEKFDYKQGQDSGLAEGQRRFGALPEKQRNYAAAAKISRDLKEELGVDVLPAKIFEDPNSPSSQVTVNNAMARGLGTEAAKRISTGANIAEQAIGKVDTINRIMDVLDSEKVNLGPLANAQQFLGQIANKIAVGGKTNDERLANTRTVIQGLAELVLANRSKLEGQGSVSNYEGELAARAATPGEINNFTVPELKALLAVADRAARLEYGAHEQRMKLLRDDPDVSIRRDARVFEVGPLPSSRFGESKPSSPSSDNRAIGKGGASDAPKADFHSRYRELEKSGKSKQDIFKQLQEEGY